VKVLSGRFKNTAIPFKPQADLRPTPDRVRKAIIDALRPAWDGVSVLDLFSGTGAMGLEALSAGAARAVFVEADRRRAEGIRQTLRHLKIDEESRVEAADVFAALERLAGEGERFDRVLADPPYDKGLALKTLEFFSEGAALTPGAWIALETRRKEVLPDTRGRLTRRKTAEYGDTAVHYYVLV
jgi:16S rRNA (guanine966-N2)-methyltransferase